MKNVHTNADQDRRRPVNVSIRASLVDEAKKEGINISAIAEAALSVAVQDARLAAWAAENAAGLAALNKFIEEEGLPLAHRRLF